MTKSNRQRDVSVRLDSHHPGIGGTFTANLADKILALQLQHAHEKAPRFIQKNRGWIIIPAAVAAIVSLVKAT
jgi:hypothetical protein